MLTLPGSIRIFVTRKPVDLRKSHDGLCAVVRDHLRNDPFTGHLFVFFNRRRDRVKLLLWDRNGFWLFYKRLEQGTFEPLVEGAGRTCELTRARLSMLLEGIPLKGANIRLRFADSLGKRIPRGGRGWRLIQKNSLGSSRR